MKDGSVENCCKKALYPIISHFPPCQDTFSLSTILRLCLSVSQLQALSVIFHLETLPQLCCAFSALCSPSPICSLSLSFSNAFQGTTGSCKNRVCTFHMWMPLFLSPHPPVPGRNWSIISPGRVRYFFMVLYPSFE